MKKLRISGVVVFVFFFVLVVHPVGASSYWQRISEGFSNQVLVYDYFYNYDSAELEITAKVPQLFGMSDLNWQNTFNSALQEGVEEFAAQLQEIVTADQTHPYQGIIDYEVKLNRGGLLSLAITFYTYTGGAHGMTWYVYHNIDLTTGHELSFYDLFDSEIEVERAASIIDSKIVQEPDWFFIDHFTPALFSENQGFYLQDKQVVICFGLYELAPYAAGIQEFVVSAP